MTSFNERPQNIPSGLLKEVKEHLAHMLNMGAINPVIPHGAMQ